MSEIRNIEKVYMSPRNAQLVLMIPLVPLRSMNIKDQLEVVFIEPEATAYMADIGAERLQLLGAEWVESNLIFLGDL